MLGRRESSQRMWKWRQVTAGTRTCRGGCGQGMATVLRSPATSPPCPQGHTCGGTSPVSTACCRSWAQGSKSCQGVRSWALQGQSGISRADVGQETGCWGTGRWGAHGAGGRTLGDTDMGSTRGKGHTGQGTGHGMPLHSDVESTWGRGTGCHGTGHRGGMWRGTRTLGDPWGCGRRGGVVPWLPTHLNRTEILFSVAAMLYTSSSSRDEAWAGPGVGNTPHGVGDALRGVGDPRRAGDTLLPAVPCWLPTPAPPRPALPCRCPGPARPGPPLSLQVPVPLLSPAPSWLWVPVPSPVLESESLPWGGLSSIPGSRSMS